jgi:integrase/recombinase XerD
MAGDGEALGGNGPRELAGVPSPEGLARLGMELPALFRASGRRTQRRFLEFFTAEIRNPNTRRAYGRAVARFSSWCEGRGFTLERLEPVVVAAYIEELQRHISAPSVKQHLAGIRMLMDYLVTGGRLTFNPAAAVRGPKHVVKVGKTPVLSARECRALFDSIDTSTPLGLRDRALLALMAYSFARVGAAVRMQVRDYYTQGKRAWFRLHEKGGKYHQVPAHHSAVAYMDAYLAATGIENAARTPLFRAVSWRTGHLREEGITEDGVLQMVKRRARDAGLPSEICCHTFRATGITAYLANGGALSTAQAIAGHESPRTTKLYDRTSEELSLDEIERIRI